MEVTLDFHQDSGGDVALKYRLQYIEKMTMLLPMGDIDRTLPVCILQRTPSSKTR
jgi:hypothetical protein